MRLGSESILCLKYYPLHAKKQFETSKKLLLVKLFLWQEINHLDSQYVISLSKQRFKFGPMFSGLLAV